MISWMSRAWGAVMGSSASNAGGMAGFLGEQAGLQGGLAQLAGELDRPMAACGATGVKPPGVRPARPGSARRSVVAVTSAFSRGPPRANRWRSTRGTGEDIGRARARTSSSTILEQLRPDMRVAVVDPQVSCRALAAGKHRAIAAASARVRCDPARGVSRRPALAGYSQALPSGWAARAIDLGDRHVGEAGGPEGGHQVLDGGRRTRPPEVVLRVVSTTRSAGRGRGRPGRSTLVTGCRGPGGVGQADPMQAHPAKRSAGRGS
jgi:hypothetical protein